MTIIALFALLAMGVVIIIYWVYLYIKYLHVCDVCGGNGYYLNAERYEFLPCPNCKGK